MNLVIKFLAPLSGTMKVVFGSRVMNLVIKFFVPLSGTMKVVFGCRVRNSIITYNKIIKRKSFEVGELVWKVIMPVGSKDKELEKWSPN